jgi:hypothetical protein
LSESPCAVLAFEGDNLEAPVGKVTQERATSGQPEASAKEVVDHGGCRGWHGEVTRLLS